MREAWKSFHLSDVLFSENDYFVLRPCFVCILRIKYLENKGARGQQILLRFFIPHRGLPITKRWDLKALDTWGTSLVRVNLFFFMRDGAPAHYGSIVRDWLDENFPARWIGRRVALDWPSRSPDLTPADYFLWGYLKDIVYQKKHRTLSSLKQSITSAFSAIGSDLCQKDFKSASMPMVVNSNIWINLFFNLSLYLLRLI